VRGSHGQQEGFGRSWPVRIKLSLFALLSGHPWAAALVALTIFAPLSSQVRLYREPTHRNFVRYMLISNPLIIAVQLGAAFIVGGYLG
jgi:hypothetical protein